MNLVHLSHEPLKRVWSVYAQPTEVLSSYDKPNGLWVSVEGVDDWASWCSGEMPYWLTERYHHATRVLVNVTNDILWLNTPQDLDEFTQRFLAPARYNLIGRGGIDWSRVAESYGGVVATRYLHERRMDSRSSWYYGWDCSGGCIWNADNVSRLVELEPIFKELVREDEDEGVTG